MSKWEFTAENAKFISISEFTFENYITKYLKKLQKRLQMIMSTQKDYVKIPKPISINSMTDAEFDAELEKGYQNIIKGNVVSARQLFKSIKEDYNL